MGAAAAFYLSLMERIDNNNDKVFPGLFQHMSEHTIGVSKESWLFLADFGSDPRMLAGITFEFEVNKVWEKNSMAGIEVIQIKGLVLGFVYLILLTEYSTRTIVGSVVGDLVKLSKNYSSSIEDDSFTAAFNKDGGECKTLFGCLCHSLALLYHQPYVLWSWYSVK